jgi:immune inhibitor A
LEVSGKVRNFGAEYKSIIRKMKRLFIVFVLVLLVTGAWSAPALKGFFTMSQPDGTQLSVAQFGDEYHHWTETADGTLIVNKEGAYYVAAIDDSGELSATSVLAHEAPIRGIRERQQTALQTSRKSLFHRRRESAQSRSIQISTTGGYLPHKGSPRVLTIMAAFQDSTFTVNEPLEAFDQYLNGETQMDLGNKNHYNQTSVQRYFDICSQGQFTPQFDIVGPVTLPREQSYYGKGNDRFYTFCRDAVISVRDQVDDWTVYDNDGDGNIEMVCIIFAGYGENQGGGEETLWARASRQNIEVDGCPRINFFNCSSELYYPLSGTDPEGVAKKDYINGNGVFIHEMSHCLGLPDLYQTDGIFTINQGMEAWDVMDYGLYNRNGFAPAAYTAWEREAMGWIDIVPVTAPQHLSGLLPLDDGGKAYKFVNTADESGNEYIVMECIANRGLNSYAYGSGLLVYHVAYPSEEVNMLDRPNNTIGRPRVAVVPACGTLLNADLCGSDKEYSKDQWKESMAGTVFPGNTNVASLTSEMNLPNYLFYDGSDGSVPVGIGLYDIAETTEGIRFDIRTSGPDAILSVPSPSSDGPHDCYDLLGRSISHSSSPSHTLYIDRKTGRKYVK